MSNLKYISILKPEGSSKDWEARLITACRNNKVNCERRMKKRVVRQFMFTTFLVPKKASKL